jgi:hypothetical protein
MAGTVRRHVLTAAQASLRALRELLAHFPTTENAAPRPPADVTPVTPASPMPAAPASPPRTAVAPAAPTADLLRSASGLPTTYGTDRLVLLARDPHCLYAYWDISDTRTSAVRTDAGNEPLRMVLRTYDVTQIAFDAQPQSRFQDFAIAGDARSLYAYIGKPAACFVAEVGYLRPDGGFFPLARSLPIWTPRTDQPGAAPGRWMTVGWNERRDAAGSVIPLATSGATETAPAPDATSSAATRGAPSSWPGPAPSTQQRGSWSLVRGGLTTGTPASDN